MAAKIKKGDTVVVLTGRDTGRSGEVLQVMPKDEKALVRGINVVKKHQKPNPMKGEQGGVVDKTMPIDISNVALFNGKSGKADRVGIVTKDGKKIRVFRSSGDEIKA